MVPLGPSKGDADFSHLAKLVSVKAPFVGRQRTLEGTFHSLVFCQLYLLTG